MELITSIFVTLSVIFNLLPGLINTKSTYQPEENNILLNCVVVSDTHTDSNVFRDRTNILRNTYAGISRTDENIDVLLNIGDITNSGSESEYKLNKRLVKTYIRPENYIACIGNHDSWNGSADPDYEEAKRLFINHLNDFDVETDKVYYSKEIDGFKFICLGTEGLDLHETLPIYSETQLKWFENELKASDADKPVFVLCHKPLAGRNGTSSETVPTEVDNIMQKYATAERPVIFFSGHYHKFNSDLYDNDGNVYYFNLPSTEYNDETENDCNDNGGMGLTMEIYKDKIVIKARNFIKDKFIDGYRYEIDY